MALVIAGRIVPMSSADPPAVFRRPNLPWGRRPRRRCNRGQRGQRPRIRGRAGVVEVGDALSFRD